MRIHRSRAGTSGAALRLQVHGQRDVRCRSPRPRAFDVDRLAPEQVDFNVGFAEGGLTHAERLLFPGELTYVFHERDTTSVLMLTGIDGPRQEAMGESTLIASFRLIDGARAPKERRDILMKFAWELLAALNNSQ